MRRPRLFLLLLCIGLAGLAAPVASVYAQEQGAKPEINKQYESPDFEVWVQRFERPGREVFDKRHKIVAATGIKPSMVVADIGAGTGLFTRLFSPKVGPTGWVYAVDVSRVFIENVMRINREQGLINIEGIVNTQKHVALPPASIDLAFVCDTYHHFEYPRSTLQSIHQALRSNGTLVVIDFRRIAEVSSPWIMGHVRAGKATVIKEIEAAGFRLIEDKELLTENYFLKFRKN